MDNLIYVKQEYWADKYVHLILGNNKKIKILKSEYKKLKGVE